MRLIENNLEDYTRVYLIGTKVDEVNEVRIEEVRKKVEESTKSFAFISREFEVDLKNNSEANQEVFMEVIQADTDKVMELVLSQPSKTILGSFSVNRTTLLRRRGQGCC